MMHVVEQLVPPALMRRLRAVGQGRGFGRIGGAGPHRPKLTDQAYRIDFKKVEVGQEVYYVPIYALHRRASEEIVSGHLYEPMTHKLVALLMKRLPGSMIHAGTFFGDMLPSFSRKCPGMVYAFEPVLENYVLSKLCAQANDLSNVILFNAGLGKRLSGARIDTGEESGAHRGGASQIGDSGQITALVSIDSLGIEDLTLVQLDVEGLELEALEGAAQTIGRSRPIVLVEDNSKNCAVFLRNLDYDSVGRVPGLEVWADHGKASSIKDLLKEL